MLQTYSIALVRPMSSRARPRSVQWRGNATRVAAYLAVCGVVLGPWGTGQGIAFGELALSDVIERVRLEEAKYDNCEARLRVKYRLLRAPVVFLDEGHYEVTERKSHHEYVLQDGMFRVRVEGSRRDMSGASAHPEARIRLFDGVTCRALQQTTANIIDGPTIDEGIDRPHMMIVQKMAFPVPLGTFLGGSESLEAYPAEVKRASRRLIRAAYLGPETYEGHKCQKVEVRFFLKDRDEVTDTYRLWLAEDRNYIPIRSEGYSHKWSTEKPHGIGAVTAFQEVAPGVWCPSKANVTTYDGSVLKSDGKQVPGWEETYELESFSLAPAYPVEFFKELSIPDGTAVYHVDSSGNIVDSYVKGALQPGSARRGSWLIWANLVGILLICCAVAWRARRRRNRLRDAQVG